MTYYNLSFLDNTTSILDVAAGVNDASGGWLFGLLLLFLWVVMFMVFQNAEPKSVMVGSSFVVSIIAGLFFAAGLVAWWVLIIPVVMFMASLVMKLWGDG